MKARNNKILFNSIGLSLFLWYLTANFRLLDLNATLLDVKGAMVIQFFELNNILLLISIIILII